jgi:hypothetical protein
MEHGQGYNLLALKFSRPLVATRMPSRASRRKLASSM